MLLFDIATLGRMDDNLPLRKFAHRARCNHSRQRCQEVLPSNLGILLLRIGDLLGNVDEPAQLIGPLSLGANTIYYSYGSARLIVVLGKHGVWCVVK